MSLRCAAAQPTGPGGLEVRPAWGRGGGECGGGGMPGAVRSGLLGGVLAICSACTTVIVPPEDPVDAQPVFVLDHGVHSSLVLPAGKARIVRYAYGDWCWYVMSDTGLGEGVAALLWPTRAGLGRRELEAPQDEAGIRRVLKVTIDRVHALQAGGAEIRALRQDLDAHFEAAGGLVYYSPVYDLEFVEHPQAYSFCNNSNDMVAAWLERLGCEVCGPGTCASWRVEAPEPASGSAWGGRHGGTPAGSPGGGDED